MVHSHFRNRFLVIMTIASIFFTFAEANRGFGWGWGSNNSSGSSGTRRSNPKSGWGWDSSQNGSSWGWGQGPNNTHNSGSVSNGTDSSWGWGWSWGRNNTYSSGSSGWGWAPYNRNNSGSGSSSPGWGWGGRSKSCNVTDSTPRKIIVGGDKEWTYGVNYSDWASKTAPFFLNDVLVFKYNPPAPFTHSVYLLPNPRSYEKCDVKKGKMVASPKQGVGNGFEFVLREMKPYYISCGEHDGAHCSNGTMKFTVMPMLPR